MDVPSNPVAPSRRARQMLSSRSATASAAGRPRNSSRSNRQRGKHPLFCNAHERDLTKPLQSVINGPRQFVHHLCLPTGRKAGFFLELSPSPNRGLYLQIKNSLGVGQWVLSLRFGRGVIGDTTDNL